MPSALDVGNFLLGGVPGDVHELFVVDVEPGDLVRAATTMTTMGDTIRTIHVQLSGSVAALEGRWEGDGATAFDSEVWQPLSHGLGVLERECHTAGGQLSQLAGTASLAHAQKIEALGQEIENQLMLTGVTSLIGAPELGGAIGKAVTALAERIGGDVVSSIVKGIVDAIEELLRKISAAFDALFNWVARPIEDVIAELRAHLADVLPIGRSDVGEPGAVRRGPTGRVEAADLREQLAMEQVRADPAAGKVLQSVSMRDPRWPAAEGWVKEAQNVNGIEIHYVYNPRTGAADDFKFK